MPEPKVITLNKFNCALRLLKLLQFLRSRLSFSSNKFSLISFSIKIYEPFLDLSLPLIDQKPPRPGGSATKSNRSSNVSHNGGSLDVDGDDAVDISCFGRNKKKSEEGDEEPEGDFTKSKHQVGHSSQ